MLRMESLSTQSREPSAQNTELSIRELSAQNRELSAKNSRLSAQRRGPGIQNRSYYDVDNNECLAYRNSAAQE